MEANGCRRFIGKVAVVTGAAQGIGRATALRLGQEGARVIVADRAKEAAQSTIEALQKQGIEVAGAFSDLSTLAGAREMVAQAEASFGAIDILVNNVGGTIWAKPLWLYSEEEIITEMERSFWPTMWCCRAAIDRMVERKAGVIVNVGSNATRGLYRVPYASAKGGVLALTSSLARDTAKLGIRVNCVIPGGTDVGDRPTPRNPDGMPAQDQKWMQEIIDAIAVEVPMGRFASPEEQAATIAFLASDDASYITGQGILVTGGEPNF